MYQHLNKNTTHILSCKSKILHQIVWYVYLVKFGKLLCGQVKADWL